MKDTSVWKIVLKVIAVLAVAAGIVFAIYHWELDKKFFAWVRNLRSKCCCCAEEPEELSAEAGAEVPEEPVPQDIPGVVPECTMEDVEVMA